VSRAAIDGEQTEAARKPWSAPRIILSEELPGTSKPHYPDITNTIDRPTLVLGPS